MTDAEIVKILKTLSDIDGLVVMVRTSWSKGTDLLENNEWGSLSRYSS